VLIKRFVTEKHHKIMVVADAGRNMTAAAPSGELKCDVAANVIGALGLITLRRSDEIGMVFGDARGSVDVRLRRGETHVEHMLHRFHHHVGTGPASSDVLNQLDWVARHQRRPLLIVVVSDEPDVDDRLDAALTRLTARHDVMWAMVSDMPAIGSEDDDGFDVADGRFVFGGAALGQGVVDAYQRAEGLRRERLSEFMVGHGIPHTVIGGSAVIRTRLIAMTEVYARAG
jgi:uncharacterized protein (DUF58 family)